MLTPTTVMTLEANIEPGSVQVTVNGVAETRFTVEPVSGTVTPQFDILPTDRIVVTYRKTEQGTSGGDSCLPGKARYRFPISRASRCPAGVRWNADPWSFSQVPYTSRAP